MSNPRTVAACNKVLRAALAAKVAEREGLDLATDEGEASTSYVALIQYDLLGYPMGDSLLPLIQIANPDERPERSDEDDEIGMTWFDQQVEDTRADLHDRLLNASPRLGQDISVLPRANAILNRIYEDALRHATFAGGVEGDSAEALQAREFLFPTGDDGMPGKSVALRLYEGFEEDIRELDLSIADAQSRAADEEMRRLQQRRERKAAEWLALGQKRRVEDAIRIMNNADRDAGFEDERQRFIEELELRKIGRTVSAKDFARVDLRPLEPLINPDEKNHWRTIEISGAEIPDLCPVKIRHLFGLKLEEIELAVEAVVGFSVELATIMLSREWLSDEFLTARYWRLDDTVLADGRGGGTMPTQATRAIFLRNASYRIDGKLNAERSQANTKAGQVNLVPQFAAIETPLLAKFTTVEKVGQGGGSAKLSALAQSKLTRGQIGQMRHLVQLRNPVFTAGNTAKIDIGAAPRRSGTRQLTETKPSGRSGATPNPQLLARLGSAAFLNSANLLKPEVRRRDRRIRGKPARAQVVTQSDDRHEARVRVVRPADRARHVPSINRAGTITTSPVVTQDDFLVSLQRRSDGTNVGPEETLTLTPQGENRYGFALTVAPYFVVHPKPKPLTDVVLRLRGGDGAVLDEMIVPFQGGSQPPLVWSIARDVSLLEMTAPTHPVLFAYALQVLPLAPNPLEDLDWSGSI